MAEEYRRAKMSQRRPEYCYSVTLQTCIYEDNGWSPEFETHSVIDLLTNHILAEADVGSGEEASFKNKKMNDYKQQREKLFAACVGAPWP